MVAAEDAGSRAMFRELLVDGFVTLPFDRLRVNGYCLNALIFRSC
jgi:hypothetical protein